MLYFGIDNGPSGSLALLREDGSVVFYGAVPVKKGQDYTKKVKNVSRLDVPEFKLLFGPLLGLDCPDKCRAFLERPMVNPGRFVATASALRFLEATLIVLEDWEVPVQFLDSKEWQKALLPAGADDTKKASRDIGCRLFPALTAQIAKQGDADALLIAEWARRNKR